MQLRKIIKARGHFPSEEAALRLIWLALRNVVAKWTGSRHDWKSAMIQFALLYPRAHQYRAVSLNPPHTQKLRIRPSGSAQCASTNRCCYSGNGLCRSGHRLVR